MHVDDLVKIGRLADERTRLIESKESFLEMFGKSVERAGNPTPMTISGEYSLQDQYTKTARVWIDQYAADAIVYQMDYKIGDLDIELGKLGIETHKRGVER